MIPLFAFIRVNGRRRFRLFVPLFLLWLLVLPLLLLALPFLLLFSLLAPVHVRRGGWLFLTLLSAIRGTRLEVTASGRSVLMYVW